mgnify:CR=1 FL=1
MKKIRIISFLLTLVMILSLFSGLTASAKTGTLKVNTGKTHFAVIRTDYADTIEFGE